MSDHAEDGLPKPHQSLPVHTVEDTRQNSLRADEAINNRSEPQASGRPGNRGLPSKMSMTLPPADAPIFTMMPPPSWVDVDINEFVISPSLIGQAGRALPHIIHRVKIEQLQIADTPHPDSETSRCAPFKRPRRLLFGLTCVIVFVYAGAFFGYGPMQLMLERSGAFSHLCENSDNVEKNDQDTITCPEQNAMLLNVQLVAQLTMITSPFLGAWCDRNGPAEVAGGLLASGCLGIILLAIATSNLSIDWLLFPSFIFSGLMAQIAGLMTVQTGLIFQTPRTRTRAISTLNALYDAGAITYLILWYIETNTPLTLPRIAGIYFILFLFVAASAVKCWFSLQPRSYSSSASIMSGSSNESIRINSHDEEESEVVVGTIILNKKAKSYVRPKRVSWLDELGNSNDEDEDQSQRQVEEKDYKNKGPDDDYGNGSGECTLQDGKPSSDLDIAAAAVSKNKPPVEETNASQNATPRRFSSLDTNRRSSETNTTPRRLSMTHRLSDFARRFSLGGPDGERPKIRNKKTSMTFGTSEDSFAESSTLPPRTEARNISRRYVLISKRPVLDQLRSRQFLVLAAFFAFHHSRNTWTLTTTRDFLAYLGDDETGNRYLAIFTLLTPASVLGLPFVDKIVTKGGYSAGLHVVNMLAIGQGIIQVSSSNLNVQIVGFVFYSFYRCFLFAVCFSCLPAFLNPIVLGKGYGLLIFFGGICSLINIPLANTAVKQLDGNFFVPNLIYTVLCVPCVYLVWNIHKGFKREQAEKDRLAQPENSSADEEEGEEAEEESNHASSSG